MKSRRSLEWNPRLVAVWNHPEGMYGINPKENARLCVMPCACDDSIHDCVVITSQSFGLDRKKQVLRLAFFWQGWQGSNLRNARVKVWCLNTWLHPYIRARFTRSMNYNPKKSFCQPFFGIIAKMLFFCTKNSCN